MPDERENGIHWTICVNAARDIYNGMDHSEPPANYEDVGRHVVSIASQIWAWRCLVAGKGEFESSVELPPTPAPAPPPRPAQAPVRAVEGHRPPETPYGEEEPPHPASQEAPPVERPVQERCLCGSLMTFHPDKGSNGAWFCPEKKPSRDKVVQDEQAALHPPIWLDA